MKKLICAALMLALVLCFAAAEELDFSAVSGLDEMFEKLDAGETLVRFVYRDFALEIQNRDFESEDPEELWRIADAIRAVEIDSAHGLFITDWYPYMEFCLSDGSVYILRFDHMMLETPDGNYILKNDEALWQLIGELSQKYNQR
ncbi:MAG: hypothetical protein II920_01105 [Clostridia bacterium]|nr:hypothetical protein [Clostridia bacterium]